MKRRLTLRQDCEALAEKMRLFYCRHWNGFYCDICAAGLIEKLVRRWQRPPRSPGRSEMKEVIENCRVEVDPTHGAALIQVENRFVHNIQVGLTDKTWRDGERVTVTVESQRKRGKK